jgi:hypothetical protein
MNRGFLMFAHNNKQIDYGELALCNGLMIREHHPEAGITLVTNSGTLSWLENRYGKKLVHDVFENITIESVPKNPSSRAFRDTLSTSHDAPWFNHTRVSAYEHSPYDETILLDSDYLIANDSLTGCWNSRDDLRMNCKVITLDHETPNDNEQRLETFGIPMYWATCVYFRKSDYAATFFGLVEHVRDNYDYYQHIYKFPGNLYRNDYAFSIAAHIMSGFVSNGIPSLPCSELLTSFDCDELLDVPAKNEFIFLVNDAKERWKFTYSRLKGLSVHAMNKFSIGRNAEKIIALYGETNGA